MIYHHNPITKQDISYEFSVDPTLAEPGVPDWVTHYQRFPGPVQRALAGLYDEYVGNEKTLRERS